MHVMITLNKYVFWVTVVDQSFEFTVNVKALVPMSVGNVIEDFVTVMVA